MQGWVSRSNKIPVQHKHSSLSHQNKNLPISCRRRKHTNHSAINPKTPKFFLGEILIRTYWQKSQAPPVTKSCARCTIVPRKTGRSPHKSSMSSIGHELRYAPSTHHWVISSRSINQTNNRFLHQLLYFRWSIILLAHPIGSPIEKSRLPRMMLVHSKNERIELHLFFKICSTSALCRWRGKVSWWVAMMLRLQLRHYGLRHCKGEAPPNRAICLGGNHEFKLSEIKSSSTIGILNSSIIMVNMVSQILKWDNSKHCL